MGVLRIICIAALPFYYALAHGGEIFAEAKRKIPNERCEDLSDLYIFDMNANEFSAFHHGFERCEYTC